MDDREHSVQYFLDLIKKSVLEKKYGVLIGEKVIKMLEWWVIFVIFNIDLSEFIYFKYYKDLNKIYYSHKKLWKRLIRVIKIHWKK